MTITYTDKVSNARLCAFSRLLFFWKGSIYKLMYKEMAIFCLLYVLLSCLYRFLLHDEAKRIFEKISLHCESFINLIPLSFVLGFYVALIIGRWWNQFQSIPWPDRIMLYLTTSVSGNDEQSRVIRRTLMRYLSLGSIIVFQATSVRVKKRFPTMDHLIEAGIITHEEVKLLDEVSTPHGKWWVPFVWSCNIVKDAFSKGLIADSILFKTIMDEIIMYKGCLGRLYSYDWISVPLVYTQVTTLAVYTFFLGCTLGRQFLDPSQNYPGHDVDLYVPLFTLLQFFFYMGWLKVAEQLINPFGEDDDDFEMNWIIDRNMQVSLLTVDTLHGQFPMLTKDIYYGESPPDYLPYTKSSSKHISLPHMGSTAEIRISDEGMKLLTPMETIQEGVAMGNNAIKPDSGINTPITFSHKHQNLMSGTKSPTGLFSRTSLYSKCSDEGHSTNHLGSTLVHKAKEKLSKWLSDQSSQVELNRLSAYHHNYNRHSSVDSTDTLPSDILPGENLVSQFTRLPILPEYRNASPPSENSTVVPQPTQNGNTTQPVINTAPQSIYPNHLQSSFPQQKKPFHLLTRLSQRYPRTHTISLNQESQFFDVNPKTTRSNYYRHRYNNYLARDFDSQTLFAGSTDNVNKISAPSLPCVTVIKPMKHKIPGTPFFKKKLTTSKTNTPVVDDPNPFLSHFDSKNSSFWNTSNIYDSHLSNKRKLSYVSDIFHNNSSFNNTSEGDGLGGNDNNNSNIFVNGSGVVDGDNKKLEDAVVIDMSGMEEDVGNGDGLNGTEKDGAVEATEAVAKNVAEEGNKVKLKDKNILVDIGNSDDSINCPANNILNNNSNNNNVPNTISNINESNNTDNSNENTLNNDDDDDDDDNSNKSEDISESSAEDINQKTVTSITPLLGDDT